MTAGDIAAVIARHESGCDAEPKPWQKRAADELQGRFVQEIQDHMDDMERERENTAYRAGS